MPPEQNTTTILNKPFCFINHATKPLAGRTDIQQCIRRGDRPPTSEKGQTVFMIQCKMCQLGHFCEQCHAARQKRSVGARRTLPRHVSRISPDTLRRNCRCKCESSRPRQPTVSGARVKRRCCARHFSAATCFVPGATLLVIGLTFAESPPAGQAEGKSVMSRGAAAAAAKLVVSRPQPRCSGPPHTFSTAAFGVPFDLK